MRSRLQAAVVATARALARPDEAGRRGRPLEGIGAVPLPAGRARGGAMDVTLRHPEFFKLTAVDRLGNACKRAGDCRNESLLAKCRLLMPAYLREPCVRVDQDGRFRLGGAPRGHSFDCSGSTPSVESVLTKSLLLWFRASFFRHRGAPACAACKARGDAVPPETMVFEGIEEPSEDDIATHGVRSLGVYKCGVCQAKVRVPWARDVATVLRDRQGGEQDCVSLFLLCCSAIGLRAREVLDWGGGRTWAEVWWPDMGDEAADAAADAGGDPRGASSSPSPPSGAKVVEYDPIASGRCFEAEHAPSPMKGRWTHVDPAEGRVDCPGMYAYELGLDFTYVIAVGRGHCVDVTPRYVKDPKATFAQRGVPSPEEIRETVRLAGMTLREAIGDAEEAGLERAQERQEVEEVARIATSGVGVVRPIARSIEEEAEPDLPELDLILSSRGGAFDDAEADAPSGGRDRGAADPDASCSFSPAPADPEGSSASAIAAGAPHLNPWSRFVRGARTIAATRHASSYRETEPVYLSAAPFVLEPKPLVWKGVRARRLAGGTCRASGEYRARERAAYAFDGRTDTKWLCFGAQETGAWIEQRIEETREPLSLLAVTLASANDFPARDPRRVVVECEVDGAWVAVGSFCVEFAFRHQKVDLPLLAPSPASRAFRVRILSVRDARHANSMQLGQVVFWVQ